MMESRQIRIGDYLLTRLWECGIDVLFGVPGDFNLPLLEELRERDEMRWVGNCNELNAAYAADGYARMNGAGALVVTYGVGDLSAMNGIAGAYAEHVPVICISGIPPLHAVRKRMLLHHTSGTGNLEDVMHAMAQFTEAQSRITPANATSEIDRVLSTAMREKRPVYLQIPSDIFELQVEAPTQPLEFDLPKSDPKQLQRVVEAIEARLAVATHPVLLVDADAQRFGLGELICELGEARGIRFASMSSGRSIFDEEHGLFAGIYGGAGSKAAPVVEASDCLIAIGVRFADANTGVYSHDVDEAGMILIDAYSAVIAGDSYEGVRASEVLEALIAGAGKAAEEDASAPLPKAATVPDGLAAESRLTHANLWPRIAEFLRAGDVIVAEAGTSMAGINSIHLPAGVDFISQSIWASIGYTLPAMLGLMMCTEERRHLLFIGDGSLQMTAQEISTMIRQKAKGVIFVVNNDGYTIERLIYGPQSNYNEIQQWRYSELGGVFDRTGASAGYRASTIGELAEVLEKLQEPEGIAIVELVLDAMDAPPSLVAMGKRCAEFDFGVR